MAVVDGLLWLTLAILVFFFAQWLQRLDRHGRRDTSLIHEQDRRATYYKTE